MGNRTYQHMKLLTTILGIGVLGAVSLSAQDLFNLNEEPASPRFPKTDREWPAKPGEAVICLWEDDKLAAISLTIDDNCAPNIPWWTEQAERYGLKPTWFLITKRIGTVNTEFNGTWQLWKDLLARGYGIESHTAEHLHTEVPGWGGIEWEYTEAIKDISNNLDGYRALCLASPGGENKKLKDPGLAAKHYIANRGTRRLSNRANQIHYQNVNLFDWKTEGNLEKLLDPQSKYFRDWAVTLSHILKEDGEAKAGYLRLFEFYKTHERDLWGGLFRHVALYGQERDTAHLNVEESLDSRIRFTLGDKMDNAIYDYPLTIKVHIPQDWARVQATQEAREIPCRVVEHQGARFAMVRAVPDRSPVVLAP